MKNTPKILTSKSTCYGVKLVQSYKFHNGPDVPMYEVSSVSGLNQLIGFAKFINRDYGEVYYRGVNKVYNTVLPALMRNRRSGEAKDLKGVLNSLYSNAHFCSSLKLVKPDYGKRIPRGMEHEINAVNRNNKNIIEGVIQHYSGSTRFLDIVDNHWVALWMGLHQYEELGKGYAYCRYTKRVIPSVDYLEKIATKISEKDFDTSSLPGVIEALSVTDEDLDKYYMYILLIAVPNNMIEQRPGAYEDDNFALIDLRKALPSIFLRPHAQHAYVVKTRDKFTASEYDLSSQVVGILRIRVDVADEWLGNGTLLTQANLFPTAAVDAGYHSLLQYHSELQDIFRIRQYLSDVL